MAILEQIVEPDLGKPGWNPKFKQVLDRVNLMPEIVFDALAQKIVAGSGIAINYNSTTKVFTFSATGSAGLDTEAMMDWLAAHLVIDGEGGTLTYDDEAGDIHLSIAGGSGGSTDVELVRDTIGTALVAAGSLQKTVDDTGDTITLSNAPRVVALTDGATITPNADTTDIAKVTIAGNRTMANPTGTLVGGQKLIYRIKQDGTGSRLISSWGSLYRFPGGTAPTLTTAAGKTDYLGFIYNSDDTKLDMVAITKNL